MMIFFTELVSEAEEQFYIDGEDDEIGENMGGGRVTFSGLKSIGSSRWNSILKMARSQREYNGSFIMIIAYIFVIFKQLFI